MKPALVVLAFVVCCRGETITACSPGCEVDVMDFGVSANVEDGWLFASGWIRQAKANCPNCASDQLDISLRHSETFQFDELGGQGFAKLVPVESEWASANDDIGSTDLSYILPDIINRQEPFSVILEVAAGGTVSSAGVNYVGGTHYRAWRMKISQMHHYTRPSRGVSCFSPVGSRCCLLHKGYIDPTGVDLPVDRYALCYAACGAASVDLSAIGIQCCVSRVGEALVVECVGFDEKVIASTCCAGGPRCCCLRVIDNPARMPRSCSERVVVNHTIDESISA